MNIKQVLYYAFIALIIIVGATLIFSLLPIKDNIKILTVLSGSMEPTIKTGSVIIIKPVSSYKVGDIVTFGEISKTSIPKTHRITRTYVQNDIQLYATKGDANDNEDGKSIKKEDIKGKVILSIPYLGYAVSFAQTKKGFLLLIIIPCVLIIVGEFLNIKKNIKREDRNSGESNQESENKNN